MTIKTCPFCGEKPKIFCLSKGSPYEAYYVQCTNEKCEAEIRYPHKTETAAVEDWNNRVESKEIDVKTCREPELANKPIIPQTLIDEFTSKFDPKQLWMLPVLIMQIDPKTWKFPFKPENEVLTNMMDYIEQNNELKDLYGSIKQEPKK